MIAAGSRFHNQNHINYWKSGFNEFIFDQTGRPPKAGKLLRPAAGLTPETFII
jgi:hypothetical protein